MLGDQCIVLIHPLILQFVAPYYVGDVVIWNGLMGVNLPPMIVWIVRLRSGLKKRNEPIRVALK
jgi:hypothetical protein